MPKSAKPDELFPDIEAAKVLIDEDITSFARSHGLIDTANFDEACLQGCSYDIRVGNKAVLGGTGRHIDLGSQLSVELDPGTYAGVISMEKVTLPRNVVARLGAKRKFSYQGLILLSGHTIDPGYSGHLVFGIYNASPKKRFIRRGDKICTAVFMMLGREPARTLSPDPFLSKGDFPAEFLKNLDELDVIPYIELHNKIGEIGKIKEDIGKLQERYNDVFGPMRRLQQTVERLTDDVGENTVQIGSLTSNVNSVLESIRALKDRHTETTGRISGYERDLQSQKVITTVLKWAVGAVWTFIVVVATLLIKHFLFSGPQG